MIQNYNLKCFLFISLLFVLPSFVFAEVGEPKFWKVQSIDTMKYSRDLAREKLNDSNFDAVIDKHVGNIASLGATHIAIATPYDSEFLPYLNRWVKAARKYNLKVWFRGNWSGWEKWFNYPAITREEHLNKTKKFILNNPDLFVGGDIFTACPECENGGPTGDPRSSGDVGGHRKFLIDEHNIMSGSFNKIGKSVIYNYNSMNGDVARLIMDKATTKALGGVVTIDHYVRTPEKLVSDIREIHNQSGGMIVLGEIGVPIPDIHGRLDDSEQANWMNNALSQLVKPSEVIGINYWLSYGGSTSLWRDNGTKKPIADILTKFYSPKVLSGYIKDENNKPISSAKIENNYSETTSLKNGFFEIPYLESEVTIDYVISANGYSDKTIKSSEFFSGGDIKLDKIKIGYWKSTTKYIRDFISYIL